MDYLKNHCWCSDSNWGGHYDCQIIVGLCSYRMGYTKDWENLIEQKPYFCQESYDRLYARYGFGNKITIPDDELRKMSSHSLNTLKPEVIAWLEKHVPERNGVPGWCIGSDDYVRNDSVSTYSIFFQERKDAMAFIRRWSIHKKPVHYVQYFTDVRKRLNLATGKYVAE